MVVFTDCSPRVPNPSPTFAKTRTHVSFEAMDFHFPGPQMCPGCKKERSRRDAGVHRSTSRSGDEF